MAAQYKTIHPVKYYRDYLSHNIRPDGREKLEFRPISINVESIKTADGSAIVKLGNTTVICGIKAEIAAPKANESDKGYVVPNIELTPLCSPKYRPGAPSDEAQVLSRTLTDIVTNSECIDLTDLCIVKDLLVWVLYCDLVCLNHDGSILDAAVIAIIAALNTLKLPDVQYDVDTKTYKVEQGIKTKIHIKSRPVATTFMVFDDDIIIADPTSEEEYLSTSFITVAISNDEVCFIFKPGGSSLPNEKLDICIQQAKLHEKSVCNLLETVLKVE